MTPPGEGRPTQPGLRSFGRRSPTPSPEPVTATEVAALVARLDGFVDLVERERRAHAAERAERRVDAERLDRILADQSDAVDDSNEVFGRLLARLADDVATLSAEVAALRRSLAPTARDQLPR